MADPTLMPLQAHLTLHTGPEMFELTLRLDEGEVIYSQSVRLGREAIRNALPTRAGAVDDVIEAVRLTLTRTPPELLASVQASGIMLTGAEDLGGLARILSDTLGVQVCMECP